MQEIHQGAFGDFWYLTGITIPEGVYYVGGGAFEGCSGLTSVTLPNSLSTLSDRTFVGCQNLSAVTMPNALTAIGGHAFADCTSLSSITIPNTVVQIGNDVGEEEGDDGYTFVNCPLTSVTIPASVQSIAEYSFGNLRNLQWIEFKGTTPPQHGTDVFYNIGENIPIYVPCDSVDVYKQVWSEYATLIECKEEPFEGKARLTLSDGSKVIIPGSGPLKSDETKAYSATCVSVEIGSACTSIGQQYYERVFAGFYNLTAVSISDSVTNIGMRSFDTCTGLTSIVIPDSVTTIGGAAFNRCSGLTSVTIGNGVTSIGDSGFSECSGLTSIVIPSGVTIIRQHTFNKCSGLTSVTIPSGVTSINQYAFADCRSLTQIDMPDSVTSVNYSAFNNDVSLSDLTLSKNLSFLGYRAFEKCTSDCLASVGQDAVHCYS